MYYDVIIIGGGPAGLSAALNFGRGMKRTLIIDEDKPRNRVTQLSHGFLTQDGVKPTEFKRKAKADVVNYNDVTYLEAHVEQIEKIDKEFIVKTQAQTYNARQVLLATGLREHSPDITNFNDFYGQSIFYCPWCDGYEMRNKKLAVIYSGEMLLHMVKLLSNFSQEIVVFTNGEKEVLEADKALLNNKGIDIYTEPIARLIGNNGHLDGIELIDEQIISVEGAFAKMYWDTQFDFLNQLSITRDGDGKFDTDIYGETSVEGLYVAGEAKDNFAGQLLDSAANGGMIAKMMMMKQIEEDF
ncbi:NAD(P)/FAD-dependent oxidoreductase [Staphylococcus pseudoxylosus]|uniref:NAD(P)/FAD-dependent oxidoreductase n=1 Tax=Staphylococcus pseudoxylosus TaxID=2282419 RepID=UPI00298F5350|nr:NAD(P)/FAD-dependent oxidoreductase [Staphylococcus pseudoxylosus]MDW8798958.1 NAD(P)/FAD-dependent oxidoreductase [Staphylococcus pseudoxylosus]MEB6035659.1 NAD(P)/FAD-dependent oxidoreductase [Staphylococcus pseudoxylosus]MEB6044943.1 NAD(P)/FAD-dependent oxidoreductase [Staphylococcus pseudoxylosus]MEB7763267.1 NAD(P)/FAD-dependent oxidoreductase [Staphylococcus pseudoxylosus]MEB8007822.1 NAD(P)/FAD-dependent oxidoreductase [Staphylococcus pseudoxylosus]